MFKRIINVFKWILIILGALFLTQIILTFLMVQTLITFPKNDTVSATAAKKPKEIQQVIDYVENYKKTYATYPNDLTGFKIKNGLNYQYTLSEDKTCYTVTIKSEKSDNAKQYSHCQKENDTEKTHSESYVEYKN